MGCCKSYKAQSYDEAGKHAVKLQKTLVFLFLASLFIEGVSWLFAFGVHQFSGDFMGRVAPQFVVSIVMFVVLSLVKLIGYRGARNRSLCGVTFYGVCELTRLILGFVLIVVCVFIAVGSHHSDSHHSHDSKHGSEHGLAHTTKHDADSNDLNDLKEQHKKAFEEARLKLLEAKALANGKMPTKQDLAELAKQAKADAEAKLKDPNFLAGLKKKAQEAAKDPKVDDLRHQAEDAVAQAKAQVETRSVEHHGHHGKGDKKEHHGDHHAEEDDDSSATVDDKHADHKEHHDDDHKGDEHKEHHDGDHKEHHDGDHKGDEHKKHHDGDHKKHHDGDHKEHHDGDHKEHHDGDHKGDEHHKKKGGSHMSKIKEFFNHLFSSHHHHGEHHSEGDAKEAGLQQSHHTAEDGRKMAVGSFAMVLGLVYWLVLVVLQAVSFVMWVYSIALAFKVRRLLREAAANNKETELSAYAAVPQEDGDDDDSAAAAAVPPMYVFAATPQAGPAPSAPPAVGQYPTIMPVSFTMPTLPVAKE